MAKNLMAVLQAIDQFYGEVLEDAHWTQALRALQEVLGSACICVAMRDENTGHTVQHTSRGVSTNEGDRLVPACSVEAKIKLNSRNENEDSLQQYYWHCEPDRCRFCLGAPLSITDGVSGVVATHWQQPEADSQSENRRILQLLLPHIARSLLIDYHETRLRNLATGSAFLMDRVTQAIMIVDAQGQLTRINHNAEQVLTKADGLIVVDGNLKTLRADQSNVLQRLIAAAIKPGHSKGGSRTSVSRSTGDRPYAVMIEPLLATDVIPAYGQSAAIIIISDLQNSLLLPWRALADLFNLTRNEARLAARLGTGKSLKEAASELKISHRTASLHLEHLMHKTDTHRQSDLLRLLLLSPAVLVEQEHPQD